MSKRRKPKSAAARAHKRAQRYLTPQTNAAGDVVGYRFNPGPHLRAAGVKSRLLQHDDGRWMSFEEAKLYRDAAMSGAAAPALAAPVREDRTLNALWAHYLKAREAEIAKNEALPAGRRNEDVIKRETLRFYKSMIKPWLRFAGDTLVAALDGETIKQEYQNQKTESGHTTAHASLRALMAVLAFGVAAPLKWLAKNEAADLGLARPRGRLRLGSPEEIAALIDAADALAARALIAARDAARVALTVAPRLPAAQRDRYENGVAAIWLAGLAAATNYREVATAIVAALWTAQRQADVLACDLTKQLRDGVLIFARTFEEDFSQQKVRDRVEDGGQAQVLVLPPLAERLNGRASGLLVRTWTGEAWNKRTFRGAYAEIRAEAAKAVPTVASLQYRDLRDTSITRLDEAGVKLTDIALWSGHSLKTIEEILREHYLVSTRARAKATAERVEQWRKKSGVKW